MLSRLLLVAMALTKRACNHRLGLRLGLGLGLGLGLALGLGLGLGLGFGLGFGFGFGFGLARLVDLGVAGHDAQQGQHGVPLVGPVK